MSGISDIVSGAMSSYGDEAVASQALSAETKAATNSEEDWLKAEKMAANSPDTSVNADKPDNFKKAMGAASQKLLDNSNANSAAFSSGPQSYNMQIDTPGTYGAGQMGIQQMPQMPQMQTPQLSPIPQIQQAPMMPQPMPMAMSDIRTKSNIEKGNKDLDKILQTIYNNVISKKGKK